MRSPRPEVTVSPALLLQRGRRRHRGPCAPATRWWPMTGDGRTLRLGAACRSPLPPWRKSAGLAWIDVAGAPRAASAGLRPVVAARSTWRHLIGLGFARAVEFGFPGGRRRRLRDAARAGTAGTSSRWRHDLSAGAHGERGGPRRRSGAAGRGGRPGAHYCPGVNRLARQERDAAGLAGTVAANHGADLGSSSRRRRRFWRPMSASTSRNWPNRPEFR